MSQGPMPANSSLTRPGTVHFNAWARSKSKPANHLRLSDAVLRMLRPRLARENLLVVERNLNNQYICFLMAFCLNNVLAPMDIRPCFFATLAPMASQRSPQQFPIILCPGLPWFDVKSCYVKAPTCGGTESFDNEAVTTCA